MATIEQLSRAINSYPDGVDELIYEIRTPFELDGVGTIEWVAQNDGGVGDGGEIWFVFSHEGHLYRLSGFYSSYDSNEWDDEVVEVFPRVIAKTIYEVR